MAIVISLAVRQKLASKHGVSYEEVEQCFCGMGATLIDSREQHVTNPPTRWFVGETDYGRKLKVVFILDGSNFIVKTVYPANDDEIRIYEKFAT